MVARHLESLAESGVDAGAVASEAKFAHCFFDDLLLGAPTHTRPAARARHQLDALRDTLHHVRKTSVYLTEEESRRLAAIARAQGVSQARVIREAIRAYEVGGRRDREFQMLAVAQGEGGSIADVPEEELLVGFGE